jgi:heme oxygenase (biliverdin-IX-beta and delta-forming)
MPASYADDTSTLPMSAMAALRAATWPSHQRLEKRLDVKARFASMPAYREHLEKLWGFCGPLEQRLGQQPVGEALADCAARRKLPLLTRDLVALGAEAAAVQALPRCEGLAPCADVAAALGCLYVLEGATLGGRTLLPMVNQRLGLSAHSGAAFLASYGDQVSSMWQGFGTALDAWCASAARSALAAQAAVATFESLELWLCGSAA